MNILKLGSAIATLIVLAACVTVNIYFPSAQAEEAAERIVEDVLASKRARMKPKKATAGAVPWTAPCSNGLPDRPWSC